jgi:hypothetical protein
MRACLLLASIRDMQYMPIYLHIIFRLHSTHLYVYVYTQCSVIGLFLCYQSELHSLFANLMQLSDIGEYLQGIFEPMDINVIGSSCYFDKILLVTSYFSYESLRIVLGSDRRFCFQLCITSCVRPSVVVATCVALYYSALSVQASQPNSVSDSF